MRKLLTLILLSFLFNSLNCKKKNIDFEPIEDFKIEGDYFIIPENSPLRGKIRTGEVHLKDFVKEIQAPASVEANSTKMVKVTPPLVGRIVKLYVKLGEPVSPGKILFSIDTPELAQAQKDYLSAKAQLLQAEIDLTRQSDLLAHGVGMQKEVQQAKTNYDVIKSQLNQSSIRLKMYKIDPENTALGEPLKVYSPIKGRIVSMNIAPGEFHNDANETLITIADLSSVWITANVQEKDIRFVNAGDPCSARVSAYPEENFNGKVLFMDDILDSESRTVKVRVEFRNPERKLKPGMFATVIFQSKPKKSILIPSKALIQEGDKKFVFVKKSEKSYEKREVRTDDTESLAEDVVIIDGLIVGDHIITDGSFYLLKVK
ncbi:efflux transporter, RND family, MFP subunit [Leptospira fainei serovar Hurstbridge str. BUT 6]|uniref:Efflux transporter, RND family, MFP subunit n=1 Tax=Leptospira fainei serovar Hurstbridge str. BUT 6 TaxID=1193011 RepID=S3V630_9LEPT|nr:efflux RND transporter periplasmic adaptor subunit [Leptospira fainei]EPG76104.1 efflux transporter, RND family, MFP subunit [Leptospira fainei serovar Hurstbridge str. BUT 6]